MKFRVKDVVGQVILLSSSGNKREEYRIHKASPTGESILISSGYCTKPWWVGAKQFLRDVKDVLGPIPEKSQETD